MKDFRDEWFFNQHFSVEEQEQLWQWVESSGDKLDIRYINKYYCAHHPNDKNNEICVIAMAEKSQCQAWIKKLGFKY